MIFHEKQFTFLGLIICLFNVGWVRSANNGSDQTTPLATAAKVVAMTEEEPLDPEDFQGLVIKEIIVNRNKPNSYLTDAVIYNSIPYQIGEEFSLRKTTGLIKKLYALGKPFSYFEQVAVSGEYLDDHSMKLIVTTYEKPNLIETDLKLGGNLGDKEIKKVIDLEQVHAMAESDLPILKQKMERLYRSKDYHFPQIEIELEPVVGSDGSQVKLKIKAIEGKQSRVSRVRFQGNHNVPEKRLRGVIFTQEDWLFGPLSKAGSYRPENLVADKHFIKNYYKSRGYFMANVADVKAVLDPQTKQFDVIFTIEEGDLYKIADVQIEGGTGEITNDFLLSHLPVQVGDLYSERSVRDATEAIRMIWGERGYAFSDVSPITVPDVVNKTVSVYFQIDLGEKIHVNRINVVGNKKTRDKVIRRKLVFAEGDLLTTMRMDVSKNKVLQLGYFDPRDGVSWKVHRLDDGWADLDLVVKERKTGKLGMNMGYGGGVQAMASANKFRLGLEAYDTNVQGKGYLLKLGGEWSKDSWTVQTLAANPWLFDRPIMGKIGFHVVKTDYENELRSVESFSERRVGASTGIGFVLSPSRLRETSVDTDLTFDQIHFSEAPKVKPATEGDAVALLQRLLDQRFKPGGFLTLGAAIKQDFRNSAEHPSSGYQWSLVTRSGFGVGDSDIGYAKGEIDASWYTPLIGEHDLVFGLHGHVGIVTPFSERRVPYREMYHIGGPESVRGFLYGQIGPSIQTGSGVNMSSSIGSTKALFVNAELIFPFTANMAMKGAIFYDGGAGWGTQGFDKFTEAEKALILNNKFDFRHAIGFGFRMLEPQPIKVDWGFKLDRRPGEPHLEVNFSTYREF